MILRRPYRDSTHSEPPENIAYFLVQALPGISAQDNLKVIELFPDVRFVVFEGYSRGTGSTEDLKLIEELSKNGIAVFRTSPFHNGNADNGYEAGLNLEKAGAIALGKLSTKSAISLLQTLTSQNPEIDSQSVINFMKKQAELVANTPPTPAVYNTYFKV